MLQVVHAIRFAVRCRNPNTEQHTTCFSLYLHAQIIKGVNDLPSCAIFLPDERTENGMQLWIEKLKQPKETVQGLFTRRIKLHFVCDITFEIDSVGFPIEVTREWLRKAGPYLKVR